MISIDKTKIDRPKVLNNTIWIEEQLLKIKDYEKPGNEIKNRYKHKEVKTALCKLYHNKCAYCEGKIPEGFSERIDHFRPKNGIGKGEDKIKNHKGYYWLAYEWTNLLPTCEKCNGIKSNKFPLENDNTRITDDLITEKFIVKDKFVFENFNINKLETEKRLLLNPEIDKIEEHLYFYPNGEIKHLTEKGKKLLKFMD